MKLLAVLMVLVGVAGTVLAQTTDTNANSATVTTNAPLKIAAAEAKKHLNTEAIVTGTVAEVNLAERLVRLNFEKPFPDQVFTAVIFARNTNLFPNVARLKNKTVEISGRIADYHGRPEIILTSTNQLKVVETPAKADEAEKK